MLILSTYVRSDQKSMLNSIKQNAIFSTTLKVISMPLKVMTLNVHEKRITSFAIHYNI